ncbi:hypothetical protein A6R68_00380, partial [Neotoma lepida]
KTDDDGIDFDFTVLLHEFSTQEIIPCRIHLFWYPGKPLKVQYHCQELQSPEEASGTEEASAMAPAKLKVQERERDFCLQLSSTKSLDFTNVIPLQGALLKSPE